MSFKFGNFQVLDLSQKSLEPWFFCWRPTRFERRKGIFHMNGSMIRKSSTTLNLHLTKLSLANWVTIIPLIKTLQTFKSLTDGGLTSKEALSKMKMEQPSGNGQGNYEYLTSEWQQEKMCTFKDFLRWCNKKDVVSTLEAMQKMVDFYHNIGIDVVKLGCNLPNPANICLHQSNTAKFYPFTGNNKDFWRKFVKTWLVDNPLFLHGRLLWVRLLFGIRQTCAKVLSEFILVNFILSLCVNVSSNANWSVHNMRDRFRAGKYKPRQKKTRSFEDMVMSYFQRVRTTV